MAATIAAEAGTIHLRRMAATLQAAQTAVIIHRAAMEDLAAAMAVNLPDQTITTTPVTIITMAEEDHRESSFRNSYGAALLLRSVYAAMFLAV